MNPVTRSRDIELHVGPVYCRFWIERETYCEAIREGPSSILHRLYAKLPEGNYHIEILAPAWDREEPDQGNGNP